MDIDRFLVTNEQIWNRLAELTARARRGVARLSAAEVDELVRLYQRTSTHLSYVRTYYGDPALTLRLTGLVANAGAVVYGTRPRTFRAIGRFFTVTFPAAMWDTRRFIAVSTALFIVPALAVGVWLANSPTAIDAVAPEALREAYVSRQFEEYYTSAPAAQFASQVFTNNAQVGFLAFALGPLTLGAGTGAVIVFNAANLGVAAGLFAAAGEQPKFWGLILPHGLLELTAVFVAGGAGLRMGWTIVAPGDRRRTVALSEDGRRAFVVALGLVAVFAVAGIIEGFVTGAPIPTWLRVGIGVLAEVTFLSYAIILGRNAAAAGYTGRLDEGTLR
jgi:uncharacterized membrane protein SpoIIM required for sporulation